MKSGGGCWGFLCGWSFVVCLLGCGGGLVGLGVWVGWVCGGGGLLWGWWLLWLVWCWFW
ncbi:hypothetical protein [Pseudomonas syringae group genomosp. 7]